MLTECRGRAQHTQYKRDHIELQSGAHEPALEGFKRTLISVTGGVLGAPQQRIFQKLAILSF